MFFGTDGEADRNGAGAQFFMDGISWAIEVPSALDEISQEPKSDSQKLIRDGQLLILKDGKMYNALGVEMK